jgi:GDP-mannose transporter
MSRPQTPRSITPRGSYVNLLEGKDREEQAMFSPSKIEKERLRAEAEVNASLLREKDDGKKKEEVVAAVASPGTSFFPFRCYSIGGERPEYLLTSVPPIISYCLASIMMTVVNKFVVSGSQFTMTFLCMSPLVSRE